jgi:hypothetical protein
MNTIVACHSLVSLLLEPPSVSSFKKEDLCQYKFFGPVNICRGPTVYKHF